MACIFKVSNRIKDPMKWYSKKMGIVNEWEYDDSLESYYLEDIYISSKENDIVFQDMREQEFVGWETHSWIDLAEDNELIYGYYSEDNLEAEFIHIRHGKCIREFRQYEDGIEVDEGGEPLFSDWVDVASYIDESILC